MCAGGSVHGRVCVLRRREADARVGRVEDGVEALHEHVSVDEVEALAALAAHLHKSQPAHLTEAWRWSTRKHLWMTSNALG